jgi:hypothetical protein
MVRFGTALMIHMLAATRALQSSHLARAECSQRMCRAHEKLRIRPATTTLRAYIDLEALK